MKKKLILFLTLVCIVAVFALAACQPGGPAASTIAEVKGQSNNSDVAVTGVVYGTVKNGFYVADDTGTIFVSPKAASDVSVGDKVTVSGKFRMVANAPQINLADVTKSGTGTALTPTESTIAAVAATSGDNANFGKYVTIQAKVSKANGIYKLSAAAGTASVNVFANSNVSALDNWVNQEIVISVVLHSYAAGVWTVSYVGNGSELALADVDIEGLKTEIFQTVTEGMPQNVYGVISLMTQYANEPNVVFTWTVQSGDAITIVDNVATVKEVQADSQVTLRCTISSGSVSAYQDYTVTVKAMKTVALKDLATTAAEEGENVYVNGTVVANTENYSTSGKVRSLILADSEYNLLRVDVSEELFDSYKPGDQIRACGSYGLDPHGIGVFSTLGIKLNTAAPADYKVPYEDMHAITLESDADYEAALGPDNLALGSVKLYKLVNPYMVLSNTNLAGSNYIRFGGSVQHARSGYTYNGTGEGTQRTYSFPIVHLDNNSGFENFCTQYNVPTLATGAEQFRGYTIYAYALYEISTTWQFCFFEDGLSVDYASLVKDEIVADVPTLVEAMVAGKLTLPAESAIGGPLTWSSTDNVIKADGSYDAQAEEKTVTLKATFTVSGKEYFVEFEVTLLNTKLTYSSVSEVAAMANGKIRAFQGVIVSVSAALAVNGANVNGFWISDGASLMFVRALPALVADGGVYKIGDHTLAAGDLIQVIGAQKVDGQIDANGCQITVTAKEDVAAEDKITSWTVPATYTVSNTEDLTELFGKSASVDTLKVIKFVITPDNPFFIGRGTAASGASVQTLCFRFFFDDCASASMDGVKIGGKFIGAKFLTTELTLGEAWWSTINPVFGDDPYGFSSTSKKFAYVGEFYAVCMGLTTDSTTYYFLDFMSEGFNLRAMTKADWVEYELAKVMPEKVVAAEDGKINLPGSVTHAAVTGGNNNEVNANGITWTIDAQHEGVIDTTTGAFSKVNEAVTVTLTAHFKLEETDYTRDFTVTLDPTVVTYSTVTEALAQEDGALSGVKGIVLAFGSNTTTDGNGGYQGGLWITDGTSTMFVTANSVLRAQGATNAEKVYRIGNHTVEIGDLLMIAAPTKAGYKLTAEASNVTVTAKEAVEAGDKADYDKSGAVVIDGFAAFEEFMKGDYTNKLIKVVGTVGSPLFLGTNNTTKLAYENPTLRFFWKPTGRFALENVKLTDGRIVGAMARSSEANLGNLWWNTINPVFDSGAENYFSSVSNKFAYKGEFYALITEVSSTYYYLDILSEGFNLSPLTKADWLVYEVLAVVPTSVDASQDGTIKLPKTSKHTGNSGTNKGNNVDVEQVSLTWTCEGGQIDVTDGSFKAVADDTVVNLTVSFDLDGETHSATVTVTLKKAAA